MGWEDPSPLCLPFAFCECRILPHVASYVPLPANEGRDQLFPFLTPSGCHLCRPTASHDSAKTLHSALIEGDTTLISGIGTRTSNHSEGTSSPRHSADSPPPMFERELCPVLACTIRYLGGPVPHHPQLGVRTYGLSIENDSSFPEFGARREDDHGEGSSSRQDEGSSSRQDAPQFQQLIETVLCSRKLDGGRIQRGCQPDHIVGETFTSLLDLNTNNFESNKSTVTASGCNLGGSAPYSFEQPNSESAASDVRLSADTTVQECMLTGLGRRESIHLMFLPHLLGQPSRMMLKW